MLEVVVSIILIPIAICAVFFTGALVYGICKGIKDYKKGIK